MTSALLTHFAISAAAPPIAAKYTPVYCFSASTTSLLRDPLPIITLSPSAINVGEYASIRPPVVGPTDPMGLPGLAGQGPA